MGVVGCDKGLLFEQRESVVIGCLAPDYFVVPNEFLVLLLGVMPDDGVGFNVMVFVVGSSLGGAGAELVNSLALFCSRSTWHDKGSRLLERRVRHAAPITIPIRMALARLRAPHRTGAY